MNSSLNSKDATPNGILLKGNSQILEYTPDERSFDSELQQAPSLAFLPLLGIIIFVICSLLKVCKWSRDNARWKARGDVEFGDEAEVNYGIITAGDKDFCQIDIRSDGASVYDTVNSLRLLGNGYASQVSENLSHNTVTSYRSLLMQRIDGNHYDSIESYKAFLHKITQNKDLAVKIKLLDNYPVHTKGVAHNVVLAEENNKSSYIPSARKTGILPSKRQLHKDDQFPDNTGKKLKRRRASGDAATAKKKRLLSNLTSHKSLPSVNYTFSVSHEPKEDNRRFSRMNRKKFRTERKIPHSFSGAEVHKSPDLAVQLSNDGLDTERNMNVHNMRECFSSDNMPPLKKRIIAAKIKSSRIVSNKADLSDLLNIKMKRNEFVQIEESSSENPNILHSFALNVPLDDLISENDVTMKKMSALSDEQTVDGTVFVASDLRDDLSSPSVIIKSSSERSLSEMKTLIAHARNEFFKDTLSNAVSLKSQDVLVSHRLSTFPSNKNITTFSDAGFEPFDIVQISSHSIHVLYTNKIADVNLPHGAGICFGSKDESLCTSLICKEIKQQSQADLRKNIVESDSNIKRESQNVPAPQQVQRFHVTFVSSENSSCKSD